MTTDPEPRAEAPGTRPGGPPRQPAVIAAAVRWADRTGAPPTPEALARHLAVDEELVTATVPDLPASMVDAVAAEASGPEEGDEWRTAVREWGLSSRVMLRRHPWVVPLLHPRAPASPVLLRQHDALIGCLRLAGFSVPQAASALSLLDSYVSGFALRETAGRASLRTPPAADEQSPGDPRLAEAAQRLSSDGYVWLAELLDRHVLQPGHHEIDEFLFGLEVILDALARLR